MAQRAKAQGFKWAVLQLDQAGNDAYWSSFVSEAHAQGLLAGSWYTDGALLKDTPVDADFTIAELESEGDYQGVLAAEPVTRIWPRAVVTNFTPLTDAQGVPQPQRARPLIDAGFVCLPEADVPANPNATPERVMFTANQLGWLNPQPVLYCYGGVTLADYPNKDRYFGWSAWSGDSVL